MNDIYDLVIIGGGPAGLAASIYASRSGYDTLVLEKVGFGGQVILTDFIDNYPGFPDGVSGFDLHEKMVKQAEKFGMKSKMEAVNKIEKKDEFFIVTTSENSYKSLAIIIASGAKYRRLNIPGEGKFASKGVSYCATCDGPFFKEKDIYVIGGGDTALTEAMYLTKFAKSVKIAHRRDRFRAIKSLVDQASKNQKITFVFNSVLTEIKGNNFVKSVVIKDTKTEEIREDKADGVFIFIGLDPNTDFVDKSILDEENHIITDICMLTKIKGLFAAGDVRSQAFRQIVCAVASGATASEYAGKYIDQLKGTEYI
jgi:thioredoxin reductase (NADPH)